MTKNTQVSCIIPFYNEELRPVMVVESVLKVKGISKIIVVDDGSSDDEAYLQIKARFPKVITIRLGRNSGKANAIKEGLKQTTADYILLMDGDLSNIKAGEIENAIGKILTHSEFGMIIFRRVEDKTVIVSRWIRHDIIFSGQRILKRDDLEKVMGKEITGYNLESAINSYMIRNHKKVYWMPLSVHNLFKQEKWGYSRGIFKVGIPAFIGFMSSPDILYQTLFFCRKRAIE